MTIVDITEATAKSLLVQWLRERDTALRAHQSWSRVTFTERQYWAGIVDVAGFGGIPPGRYGFHVYDNGEVAMVGRAEGGH